MTSINFIYLYTWRGKPPKCLTVKDNKIHNQDIFNTEIMDPVKGHIYSLDNDKCMVHESCDCRLHVLCAAMVGSEIFATTSGWVPTVRKAVAFFKEQIGKIEETAKNPDVYWVF